MVLESDQPCCLTLASRRAEQRVTLQLACESARNTQPHMIIENEERGPAVSEQSKRVRTVGMTRTLRKLGYPVERQADPT